jgi:hypothetical protein
MYPHLHVFSTYLPSLVDFDVAMLPENKRGRSLRFLMKVGLMLCQGFRYIKPVNAVARFPP